LIQSPIKLFFQIGHISHYLRAYYGKIFGYSVYLRPSP